MQKTPPESDAFWGCFLTRGLSKPPLILLDKSHLYDTMYIDVARFNSSDV